MSTQSLTYAELAEIWGVSKDAARKKVEGLRLPRKLGNDGRARVMIDLEEVTHTPKASRVDADLSPGGDLTEEPTGDQEETNRRPAPEVPALQEQHVALLQARVDELRADLLREREKAEAEILRERDERIRERDRADQLSKELAAIAQKLARTAEEGAGRERELLERLHKVETARRSWWPWKQAS